MDQDQKPKKLVIRRTTIGALKMQTGLKTGAGTCDNACGGTTPTCPEAATKCPNPPPPPPPALKFVFTP
jgi:hypothetical protein